MCPVQWGTPTSRRAPVLPFVQLPPAQTVCLLHAPERHAVIRLHWIGEPVNSYPCLGAECPYCPMRASDYTYAACLWLRPHERKWVQAIIPLGDPSFLISQTDLLGKVISVRRMKGKDSHARVGFLELTAAELPPVKLPPLLPTFDVRPFLLRRWGLFKEADLIGCDFHPPRPMADNESEDRHDA